MRVAVFGLGEAGSLIARDLAASGVEVRGYDPADVATPDGVSRHVDPAQAVEGADLVLAVTAAADARMAMAQAWDHIEEETLYADLATAAPGLERELAAAAAESDVLFADVALMAPVPGRGLGTPALASGTGAAAFATMINALGGDVVAFSDAAGDASARKLMRSVVTKGLTAVLIESLEAAAAHGDARWLWGHLVDELTSLDGAFLERMVSGPGRHAERRLDEMKAAEDFLADLGVAPHMTHATIARLRRALDDGIPEIVRG